MSKKVRELEEQLHKKERELQNLKDSYAHIERSLDYIQSKIDAIPEGCTVGPYCRACEFAVAIGVRRGADWETGHVYKETVYVCGKDRCKNFLKKSEDA